MRLNAKETAEILGVSFKTVYRWVKQNKIPHRKLNEQIYFSRYDVTQWAAQQRISIQHDQHLDAREKSLEHTSLLQALRQGGIHYRLGGKTPSEVLVQVSEHVGFQDGHDRQHLLEALLEREKMGSTAVDGIALPHPRTPLFDLIDTPRVCLFFLENAVDFGGCDKKKVRLLFVVLAPFVRSHLNLLSQIAVLLADQKHKNSLLEVPDRELVFEIVNQVQCTSEFQGSMK